MCRRASWHLDRVTLGWQLSDLIIVAARPSMGKTAFVLSMARNMAVDHEQGVAFFSLEMSSVQLMMRLIIAETGLTRATYVKSGRLTPEQWRHLESATKPLGTAPLFIDDTPALSVFEFRSKARRLKIHNDIKIIIIDYLQLMTGNQDTKGNREQEVAFISRTLKAIAKELNVPMIALSQLSRATEMRGGSKRPAAVGPPRVGRHRAGRRHRGLHPPSGVLRHQPGRERHAHGGHGRDHPRQAP